MENRPGRMARITVRDVLDKVELWRTRYARDGGNGVADAELAQQRDQPPQPQPHHAK